MIPRLSSISALSNLCCVSPNLPLISALSSLASARSLASLALSSAAQLSRYILVLTSSLAFSSRSKALGPDDRLGTRRRLLRRRQSRDLRESVLLGLLSLAVDEAEEELFVELEEEGARDEESDDGSGRAVAATSSRQIRMRFCLVEVRGV